MRLLFDKAQSGGQSCAADGLRLHSAYDPEREAERFVASSLGGGRPSHLIVLGPCLDYITPLVRKAFPRARIAVVQYTDAFEGRSRGSPDASWSPASVTSLDAFLDANVDEDAISGVQLLEWEPASRAFPEVSEKAKRAVRASLDRLTSSAATVKASGRSWIANACASFLLAERLAVPRPTSKPLLLAAAGPSLGESLAALGESFGRSGAQWRASFVVVAVSSALATCRAFGIEPDVVVATDGGYWSRLHLYPLISRRDEARERGTALATPLTALPSSSIYREARLLVLDQGSFVESELLPLLGPRPLALRLPPHGTVSGSALKLASLLSSGPIAVAGLDLAACGEREHSRPHGFDAFLGQGVSRNAPLETKLWSRRSDSAKIELETSPWRSSRALMAYASALEMDARALPGRLFRIGPEPVPLSGFRSIDSEDFARLALRASGPGDGNSSLFAEAALAPATERESRLRCRIASWRALAADASRALASGELPDDGAGGTLVCELLRSIDIVDYAAARRAALSGGDPRPAAAELASAAELFLGGLERRFSS
jgi:Protein of unknown function DUF115.